MFSQILCGNNDIITFISIKIKLNVTFFFPVASENVYLITGYCLEISVPEVLTV